MKSLWIWHPDVKTLPNTFCAFRKSFTLAEIPHTCEVCIAVDSKYRLWLNGELVGIGPHMTSSDQTAFDVFDITLKLKKGKNILAVQVQYIGENTASYSPKAPGMFCSVASDKINFSSNDSWECRILNEYRQKLPRRNFALAFPEYLDLRKSEDWINGETKLKWTKAKPIDYKIFGEMISRPLVPLYLEEKTFPDVLAVWKTGGTYPGETEDPKKALSYYLNIEKLIPIKKQDLEFDFNKSNGFAFCIDCHTEQTGHLLLEIESESEGVIHANSAECLLDEDLKRPWTCRRECRSASQITVSAGTTKWISWDYSGCRYLYFILRNFTGKVKVLKQGLLLRHADLKCTAKFESNDKQLNNIWKIGARTTQLCAQDLLIDCPTREQAQYSGDVLVVGPILAYCFADTRYYRQALRQAFKAQDKNGFIMARYPGVASTLYDYSLIPIIMLRDYFRLSGDIELVKELLSMAKRQLSIFRDTIGKSACVEINGKLDYDISSNCLFVDHPGLGWHNFDHKGMERDGISSSLNAFYVIALDATTELYQSCGDKKNGELFRQEADSIRNTAQKIFWNARKGYFSDILDSEGELLGFSQQANSLAILAGIANEEQREKIIPQIIDEDNPELCRCSPYFYYFFIQAIIKFGYDKELLDIIKRRWGVMVECNASTTWESFTGANGDKDSLCHAWSACPTLFLLNYWAGVAMSQANFKEITIKPRFNAFTQLNCEVPTPFGKLTVEWTRNEEKADCVIFVPKGLRAIFNSSLPGKSKVILKTGLNYFPI